jgi:hypothetical protein
MFPEKYKTVVRPNFFIALLARFPLWGGVHIERRRYIVGPVTHGNLLIALSFEIELA